MQPEKTAAMRQLLQEKNGLPESEAWQTALLESLELLQKGNLFGDFGYETVRLSTQPDGSISGASHKVYNVLKVDARTLRRKVLALMAQVATVSEAGSLLAVCTGLLQAGLEFEELMHRSLDSRDAQVLAAVFSTGKEILTVHEIRNAYRKFFNAKIGADDLEKSLKTLAELRTLDRLPEGQIHLKESIIYERP